MAKPPFKIRIDLEDIQKLKSVIKLIPRAALDRRTLDIAGRLTVKEMKSMISKGTSPVQGFGRYKAYKNPKRYPAGRKPNRPVNLDLTGEMLANLKSTPGSRTGRFLVFYRSRLARKKEQGHREGVGGQPIRPTIPERGEKFAVRIRTKLRTFMARRLQKLIKKL